MAFRSRIVLGVLWAAVASGSVMAWQPEAAKPAGAEAAVNPYIRVKDDAATGVSRAELSVRTLKPASGKGPSVSLVSAVHIADADFYHAMQAALDKHDVVLFEGVKPPGAGSLNLATMSDADKAKLTAKRLDLLAKLLNKHVQSDGSFPAALADLAKSEKRFASLVGGLLNDAWSHPIIYTVEPGAKAEGDAPAAASAKLVSLGADGVVGGEGVNADVTVAVKQAPGKKQPKNMQQQLADALGLAFQLNEIDSSKPNWRNSDMAADEVEERIAAAGGDADALFSMLDGSSFLSRVASVMLMFVKASPSTAATVKYMLLETMANVDQLEGGDKAAGAKGPMAQMAPMMKVIIKDRNKVVVDDLKKIIEAEPQVKSVAIFYGAGHMRDLEQRLVEQMGYRFDSEAWFPAIAVDPAAAGMKPREVQQMRAMIRRQIESQMKGK